MEGEFLQGMFIIVNTLLALFIFVYAISFLRKTNERPTIERRPWILLVIGAFFFLLSQILSILTFYGITKLIGLQIITLKTICEFCYGGLVLLAFITQSQLISMKDVLIIMRRLKSKKKEKELEKNIDKEMKEISKKFYK